ncbi:hypothetical protein Agub_g5521, partial [Astrephomene gubernaculifera]
MAPRIWQLWLPPDIAHGALTDEPRRFAALARCVCAEVDGALRDEADPNRWHRLVKWLTYINTFTNLHPMEYDKSDVRVGSENQALYDIPPTTTSGVPTVMEATATTTSAATAVTAADVAADAAALAGALWRAVEESEGDVEVQ